MYLERERVGKEAVMAYFIVLKVKVKGKVVPVL
jgi:hypothetical protein